jgi:ABC-type Mn2+/Zn2+ transport system ATPase subunit
MSHRILSYCGHHHTHIKDSALALETWGLCAGYPGEAKTALKNISIAVPQGKCIALVGHNGAGKSTLLKVAAGLLPVRGGEIKIFGSPMGHQHQRVVYLPQRSEIDWHFPMSVRKLVMTGRYVHLGWLRRPGDEDRRIVESAMEELGIEDLKDRQISQLSGGEQQRVLLARALAQDADLFLLDEPLNAIDAATRTIVAKVLIDLRQQGKTVMVATHFIDKLATEYDGAVYLSEGEQVVTPPGGFTGMKVAK